MNRRTGGVVALILLTALPGGVNSHVEGRSISGAPPSLMATRPALLPAGRSEAGRPLKRAVLRAASAAGEDPSATGRQILEGLVRGKDEGILHAATISPVISDRQRAAIRRLSTRSGARIHFDRRNGTPTFIRLDRPVEVAMQAASLAGDGEAVARHFLRTQRDLFKLKEPDREMKLLRRERDAAGGEHLHFQQQWRGVPVWGRQLAVHLDARKRVYLVNGRYGPSPEGAEVEPRLTPAEAQEVVQRHLGAGDLEVEENVLVLYDGADVRLAYRLDVRAGIGQRWRYFVDARSGGVLHRVSLVRGGRVVNASGTDALGTIRRFTAWEEGGIHYLLDPTRPENDVTDTTDPVNRPEATGDTYIFDARNGSGDRLWQVTSRSADGGWDPAAVSAAYNTRRVYEYFRDTFGRKSIDDKQMNLLVVIHFGQDFPNAFWNGTAMVYGDGDGQLLSPLVRCLDVAAHEMTHGVIEHTANLRYENQSGALNESFADFFGAMVDRDDWTMGEDCTLARPGYLRDLRNPANGVDPQPSRMSDYQNLPNTENGDWGGVHVNSGIPNRAAYLTVERIGREKSEQIYYRALRFYLTASSRFIDARRALIQAAEDLHGSDSPEVAAVRAAWDAVEVTEGSAGEPPSPPSSPLEPVKGDELMIYLRPLDGTGDPLSERFAPYRRNLANGADERLGSMRAFYTRPAAYTSDTATRYLFVGEDNNLYEVDENGRIRSITTTGEVYSIAVSPDGRRLAYTTPDAADDRIHLVDLESGELQDYPVVLPDYQRDTNASAGRVRYADSLAFDYSGEVILFDALVCMPRPDEECAPGDADTGFNYWTIGLLDLGEAAGSFYYPFPAQNPLFDLGYPSFAHTTSNVITFDLRENDEQSGSVQSSGIVTLDLERQEMYLVAEFDPPSETIWGVPSFWGDDKAITVQWPADGGGSTAVQVPLGEGQQRWQGVPERAGPITGDPAVAMPLMHRAGQRVLERRLEATTSLLDFGEVSPGTSRGLTVDLINTGNTPVEITSIALEGSPLFSQNGINTTLAPGARLSVEVLFAPSPQSIGTHSGKLVVTSNATPATTVVSVIGIAAQPGSGGGGGALFWVLVLVPPLVVLRLRGWGRVRLAGG